MAMCVIIVAPWAVAAFADIAAELEKRPPGTASGQGCRTGDRWRRRMLREHACSRAAAHCAIFYVPAVICVGMVNGRAIRAGSCL